MKIVIIVITIGHDIDIIQFRPVIYVPNIGQKSLKTTQIYNNSVKNLHSLHPTALKKGLIICHAGTPRRIS